MELEIKNNIYKAQCIGNVEPIEYMIPYPSMRSLIEGQNIKYSTQIIIEDLSITNLDFYNLVKKAAMWLSHQGIKPKDRIIVNSVDHFSKTILLFGAWHLGASVILPGKEKIEKVKLEAETKIQININKKVLKIISKLPSDYISTYKPLLNQEALIIFEKGLGIRLSHYNLLVNVNSIQKEIGFPSRSRVSIKLDCNSISWIIFGSILPIYCGYIIDNIKPDFTIGEKNCDFNIRHDLKNLSEYGEKDIGICPENSGCLSIGNKPIHLTNYKVNKNKLEVNGHSIMMGYLDNSKNKESFYNGVLNLDL